MYLKSKRPLSQMPHSFYISILSNTIKWHDLGFFYSGNQLAFKAVVSLA